MSNSSNNSNSNIFKSILDKHLSHEARYELEMIRRNKAHQTYGLSKEDDAFQRLTEALEAAEVAEIADDFDDCKDLDLLDC